MYPILFSWGSFILPAWHTFYVAGAIAAYYLMIFLANRHDSKTLKTHELSRLFIVCYLGGYFGARTLSIFIDEPDLVTFSERLLALTRFGPMTFYGGFLGSFFAGAIYIRTTGLSLLAILDVSIPSGLLALAVGRIGCFLNGDDFGKPVALTAGEHAPWWSSTFPNLEDGIARYPIQLMSTIAVSILVLLICSNFSRIKKRFFKGSVGIIAAGSYAILRYFIEFLRGDPRGWFIKDLITPSQFISLLILSVCMISFFILGKKSKTATIS